MHACAPISRNKRERGIKMRQEEIRKRKESERKTSRKNGKEGESVNGGRLIVEIIV